MTGAVAAAPEAPGPLGPGAAAGASDAVAMPTSDEATTAAVVARILSLRVAAIISLALMLLSVVGARSRNGSRRGSGRRARSQRALSVLGWDGER